MQAEKDHVLQGFFALFNGGPDSGGGKEPYLAVVHRLDQPVRGYFQDSAKYMAALTALFAFFTWIKGLVMPVVGIGSFAAMFAIICVVFNGVFFLLFGRTQEFEYLAGIVKEGKRK